MSLLAPKIRFRKEVAISTMFLCNMHVYKVKGMSQLALACSILKCGFFICCLLNQAAKLLPTLLHSVYAVFSWKSSFKQTVLQYKFEGNPGSLFMLFRNLYPIETVCFFQGKMKWKVNSHFLCRTVLYLFSQFSRGLRRHFIVLILQPVYLRRFRRLRFHSPS